MSVLILLSAVAAGCTVPGGGSGGDGAVQATALDGSAKTAPGGTLAFPLALNNSQDATVNATFSTVESDGLDVTLPDERTVPANGTGAYVRVHVPADAETGEHTVTVAAEDPDGGRTTADLTVHVEQPSESVDQGETAKILYTFRLDDGTLIQTNRAQVANSTMPKGESFKASDDARAWQPVPVPTTPNRRVPSFLPTHLVGMGVNHTTTFTVPASQAFGNKTLEQTREATTALDRNRTLSRVQSGPRMLYDRFLPNGTQEGDLVNLSFSPVDLPYEVTHLNESQVELTLNVSEGDRTTLQAVSAWPDSAEAVHVNATSVTFRITPTTDVGEAFTYHSYWPNATRIVEMNSTHIVLQHEPEEGTTFTQQQGRGRTVTWTVSTVGSQEIVLTRENPSPYAGQDLVVDLTVVDTQPPRRQRAPTR